MRIIILFITCLFSGFIQAQEFPVSAIAAENKARAAATLRQDDCQITMLSQSNLSAIGKKAITIHNSSGDEFAAITFYYDKSKQVKSVKGKILNSHGIAIATFNLKDFSDRSATGESTLFADYRVKYFIPRVHEYPYTVVYSYEIKYTHNLAIPAWRPNYHQEIAVEKSSFTFKHNSGDAVRIYTQLLPSPAREEKVAHMQTYRWEAENIPAEKIEPFSLPREQTSILVDIVPEKFLFFKKQGAFTNWKEFGDWVNKELLADKQQLPEATIAKVKALVAHCSTDQEKAKVLYQYLQEKTRYISIQVGIGGLEPFSATKVDQLGYGDCKALVNYMQSLLQVVNIPSYYSIVEAGKRKIDVNKDFANAADGNHIILCLPFAQDTTWLECTSNKAPFGYLGSFTSDRLVIACTPEGGKLMHTPSVKAAENIQFRKANLTLSLEGEITGNVETKFAGLQFENHLHNSFASPKEQIKFLKTAYNIDQISFENIHYQTLSDTLVEHLDIQVKSYAPKTETYYILQPNLFNSISRVPESKNRKDSLYINQGYTDIDEISIALPTDAALTMLPTTKELHCAVGSYHLSVIIEANKLLLKRKIQINSGTFPAAYYTEFYTFIQEAANLDKLKYHVMRL